MMDALFIDFFALTDDLVLARRLASGGGGRFVQGVGSGPVVDLDRLVTVDPCEDVAVERKFLDGGLIVTFKGRTHD
jgi:hypothetical protein